MAVFRIERTRDYTVMSNHHLRNGKLSLKAKGLLSMMLSLPEDWNYTTRGLAAICKEGVDAIGGALRELETAGYIVRHQLRDRQGRISDTEYVIYEQPQPKNREFATYREDLDEIVELMVETVCARRKTTRIAGSDFPHEVVRSRFLKLDSEHIRFVMDSLQKNTTEVRNMKQYLLTVLFNAPTTMSNHYTSQVNHDMNAGGW